ncbi:hypothetical protein KKF60_00030 [Patescibacteria group bacterium]|nr:hypothetical protein [Patescibacteria group bacterium]MBU4458290.1 hypothetical protein [Patescibacteria group bacterium]MCG2696205.1 hypothetical protein [Candidatus Portnoybacteria bacterium]
MENINNKSNENPLSLQEFKSMVQGLIKQEKEKTENKTGHFKRFEDIDELIKEDQRMWELVNTDWEKAQDEIVEYKNKIPQKQESRMVFAAYLSNMIMRNMYKSRK